MVMGQNFTAQFIQLLKHWSCNVHSDIDVQKTWGCSVDQCQELQFLVHLTDLLSMLLRCNGFARIQKAVVEKAMAPHSTFAWRIPWTEEPGGLQSIGSLGVEHD